MGDSLSRTDQINQLREKIAEAISGMGLEGSITAVVLELDPEKAHSGMDAVQSFFVRNDGLEVPLADLHESVWIAVYTGLSEETINDEVKKAITAATEDIKSE